MTTDEIRAAEHDIARVLVRYATSIDRRDWDRFRTCFTDDIEAVYDGIDTWHDVDAITAFMDAVHFGMGETLHRITNIDVDVAPDAATATATAYVDAVVLTEDGTEGVNTLGRYEDELVRTDDGWRIARRHFFPVRFSVIGAEPTAE
jgi:uncharacterized protein (TIGR02246 family)